jgi:hypothetical protein
MLNHQINARINEKARADTAENIVKGDVAATNNEAELRQARQDAEQKDTGLSSW